MTSVFSAQPPSCCLRERKLTYFSPGAVNSFLPSGFFVISASRVLACLSLNVPLAVIRVLADVFRHSACNTGADLSPLAAAPTASGIECRSPLPALPVSELLLKYLAPTPARPACTSSPLAPAGTPFLARQRCRSGDAVTRLDC